MNKKEEDIYILLLQAVYDDKDKDLVSKLVEKYKKYEDVDYALLSKAEDFCRR